MNNGPGAVVTTAWTLTPLPQIVGSVVVRWDGSLVFGTTNGVHCVSPVGGKPMCVWKCL